MTLSTINESPRTAARVAGALYILMPATAVFTTVIVDPKVVVYGHAAETARNIVASEQLFCAGIISNLVTAAGDVVLVVALYALLKPAGQALALLAAFWRMAECAVVGVVPLNRVVALLLLRGTDLLREFNSGQLRAVSVLVSEYATGDRVAGIFFGLGSAVFSYFF